MAISEHQQGVNNISIELNHTIIQAKNAEASANFQAGILSLPSSTPFWLISLLAGKVLQIMPVGLQCLITMVGIQHERNVLFKHFESNYALN